MAGFTVTRNEVWFVNTPSVTVTRIPAVPYWPAVGVNVSVRFEPLPPYEIATLGKSVWFDEIAVSCKLPAGVSASQTVTGIGAVADPELARTPGIGEINGGVFVGVPVLPSAALNVVATMRSSTTRSEERRV